MEEETMKKFWMIWILGLVMVSPAWAEDPWKDTPGYHPVVYKNDCPEGMEGLYRMEDGSMIGCIVPEPPGITWKQGGVMPGIDCTSEKLMTVLENLLKFVKDPNETPGVRAVPAVYILPLDPASELRHRADLIEKMSKAVREAKEALRACRAGRTQEDLNTILVDTSFDGTADTRVEIVDLEVE